MCSFREYCFVRIVVDPSLGGQYHVLKGRTAAE
jgi:hypothetical protein